MKKDRRIFHVGLFYFLVFLIFIGRLVQIQLIATDSFSDRNINLIKASVEQRTETFIINEGRGRLLSRNGEILTASYHYGLVLFPFLKHTNWPYQKVASILGVNSSKIKSAVKQADKPFQLDLSSSEPITPGQMKAIKKLQIPGVFVQRLQTDDSEPFAQHLIGVTAENPEVIKERYPDKLDKGVVSRDTEIGIMGLEEAFDPFLLSRGASKFVYHTERSGAPLFGLQVKYSDRANLYYPLKVKTTIDRDIQKIVEDAINESGLEKGGVVLLDANNSNLLAMSSRPLFDPDHPFGTGGKNHMILPQIPGSVFKIVTAAAAIEKNLVDPNQLFNCNQKLYGEPAAERQLGKLTFQESFAQSCNFTFGKLANEIIKEEKDFIETYAQKLGLLGKAGWKGPVYHIDALEHFPNEMTGNVWNNENNKNNYKSVAQTAIGQLNVRVSPLAVANMLGTIARGGTKLSVRSATQVLYENETELVSFPKQVLTKQVLSRYTVMKLQGLLRKVVKSPDGTGNGMLSDLPYTVAGKSGTAEHGENNVSNQWFAGYFPADNPKYVLVVVDLQRQEGEMKTYHIFRQIVKELHSLNRANH